MTRWNPWAHLRANPKITLTFHPSAGKMGGGMSLRRGRRLVVVLDPALGQRARRAVLAHELVHLERGGLIDPPGAPAGWDAVVAKEEAMVERIVARRLVPLAELEWFVTRACETGEGVTADLVAEEFDVPVRIAAQALRLLALEVRRV